MKSSQSVFLTGPSHVVLSLGHVTISANLITPLGPVVTGTVMAGTWVNLSPLRSSGNRDSDGRNMSYAEAVSDTNTVIGSSVRGNFDHPLLEQVWSTDDSDTGSSSGN